MLRPRSRLLTAGLAAAAAAAVGLLAAACDGNGGAPTAATQGPSLAVAEATEPERVPDGVLRIGVLAPQSGDGAAIGGFVMDAATMAVDRINEAGGVRQAEVVPIRSDEGDGALEAAGVIAELDDAGVDAVVGPTSSLVALATLRDLMSAGILTCSPTATALALDEYPGAELFFRTVPSDSMQAMAIAKVAEQTGSTTAVVAYLDDVYGRPLADATTAALASLGLDVQEEVSFTATDDDLNEPASSIAAMAPEIVVIIGDADHGVQLLSAIGQRTADGWIPDVVVNDAMRQPSSPQLVQELPEALRTRIRGVSPLARPLRAEEPPGLFGTNAYDCVNLIALASVQAGSDDPEQMAGRIVEVSTSGQACSHFSQCLALLQQERNIDYEGPGEGGVEIGPDGRPVEGRFDVFGFDETGVDGYLRTLQITASS